MKLCPLKDLRLDWCSHEAAKYAVMTWHYSRKMPNSKLVKVGVWEGGAFVGAIIYGSGANRHLARPFGLKSTEVCELVRVALAPGRDHPTSRCVAVSLKMLRRQSPGLRLVVSYADSGQGHIGTIYQAGNWFFLGASAQSYLKVLGEIVHPRTIYDRYGPGGQRLTWLQQHVDPAAERVPMEAKLKYALPLDRRMRRRLMAMAKPYPKRLGSIDSDARAAQAREDGASPIPRLQSSLGSDDG